MGEEAVGGGVDGAGTGAELGGGWVGAGPGACAMHEVAKSPNITNTLTATKPMLMFWLLRSEWKMIR